MKRASKRLANMELLRIISMYMVIMYHYTYRSEFLTDISLHMEAGAYIAWMVKGLPAVAVNCYVLLSGYFLVESQFKAGRVFYLIAQVLFYTVSISVLALLAGIVSLGDFTTQDFLMELFPIQRQHYWFLSAYMLLYVLSPILAAGVKTLTKKQLQVAIGLLLGFLCVEKSILPVTGGLAGNGFSATWFICLFLVAAYVRLYGLEFLKKPLWCVALFGGGLCLAFAENMALALVFEKTGRLKHLIGMSYEYNHIFGFLSSLGFFGLFLYHVKIKEGFVSRLLCKIGPCTLGVYLLHEHVFIKYLWPKWLGLGKVTEPVAFLFSILGACAVVFVIGILVDWLRSLLFETVIKAGQNVFKRKTGGAI